MKILSIELSGYERMAISGSTKIKIDFSSPFQLILGKNGSGKSSLLEELSPLPAHQSNYSKDGYKIVLLEHRGKQYRLESRFGKDTKHFFFMEDENLNDGGTVTVQRELVKKHFGITPEIHNLISGLDRFTEMSPAKRREWFTKLSVADYTYAIRIYNSIKDGHRDCVGALKIAKNRLVAETNKLNKVENVGKLEEEVSIINNELRVLYEEKNNDYTSYSDLTAQASTIEGKINAAIWTISKIARELSGHRQYDSLEQAQATLANAEQSEIVVKTQIKEAVGRIEEMRSEHTKAMTASAASTSDLKVRLDALVNIVRALKEQRSLKLDLVTGNITAKQVFDSFQQMQDGFLDYALQLIADPDRVASSESARELSDKIAALTITLRLIDDDLSKAKDILLHMEHQKSGGETECPRCKHRWIPGYSPENYEIAKLKLKAIEENKLKIETEIDSLKAKHEHVTTILFRQNEISRYMQAWPQFNLFWRYLAEKNVLRNDPQSIRGEIQSLNHDLLLECEVQEHLEDMERIERDLVAVVSTDVEKAAQVLKKHDELELWISELTQELLVTQNVIKSSTYFIDSIIKSQEAVEKLKALAIERNENLDATIHSIRQTVIDGCIKRHQITLGMKEKELHDIRMQSGIVNDLQSQISSLESKLDEYKAVMIALSPTEGLIAEGMLGFIRVFTTKMNHLIGKTWSYSLEVVPCGISSEGGVDLDYKFPLMTQASNKPVPDVAVGSRGMKEIVNLVFRVVAMQYLGLADVPLYLDEFASALDDSHRRSSVDLIKMLMTQMSFSQLFMVSHDFSQYGALSDVQVCALTEENIVLPPVYNTHVSFT